MGITPALPLTVMGNTHKIIASKSVPFSIHLKSALHIFLNVLQTNYCLEISIVYFVRSFHPNLETHSSEISPTRCNNCVFILRNGFTLHVSGDNLTHHQEYICCI